MKKLILTFCMFFAAIGTIHNVIGASDNQNKMEGKMEDISVKIKNLSNKIGQYTSDKMSEYQANLKEILNHYEGKIAKLKADSKKKFSEEYEELTDKFEAIKDASKAKSEESSEKIQKKYHELLEKLKKFTEKFKSEQ